MDLVTVGEAARILCVGEDTVRRLADAGQLNVSRTSTGLRIFDRSEVERLAAERLTSKHQEHARKP